MRQPEDLAVAQAVADPIRLGILQRLMDGPASVSELVSAVAESQSKVSNHLAILRERDLVESERRGRRSIYRLKSPSVAVLIEALAALSRGRDPSRATPALAKARTCYDHLAGRLGVDLLERLVAAKALELQDAASGDLGLGPRGARVFARLGVDLDTGSKRRFAFACDDWTEDGAHLGGALGAELCKTALQKGWVVRRPGTRALRVTPSGRRRLGSLKTR